MDDEKQITDMYLAAALVSYGANLLRIDKSDRKHQRFIFENSTIGSIWIDETSLHVRVVNSTLQGVETYFIAKKLVFPPNYPDTIRSIKSAIHSV